MSLGVSEYLREVAVRCARFARVSSRDRTKRNLEGLSLELAEKALELNDDFVKPSIPSPAERPIVPERQSINHQPAKVALTRRSGARRSAPFERGETVDAMQNLVCSGSLVCGCLANDLEPCGQFKNNGAARQDLGETLPRFTEHTIAARRVILQRGEYGAGISVICSGWAATVTTLPNNNRQIISLLLPGDLVSGTLIFGDKLDFSVEAITDVSYRSYDRTEFRAAMAANPKLFAAIMKTWTEKNIQIMQLAAGLGQCTAKQRIGQLVLKLVQRLALDGTAKDLTFFFPLKQRDIAEITGLTSIHVNRVIRWLRQEGLIDISNRALTIPNPSALRRISNM